VVGEMSVWQVVLGCVLVIAGAGLIAWRKRVAVFNAKMIRNFGGAGSESTARLSTPASMVASGIGTVLLGCLFILWALPHAH